MVADITLQYADGDLLVNGASVDEMSFAVYGREGQSGDYYPIPVIKRNPDRNEITVRIIDMAATVDLILAGGLLRLAKWRF